MNLKKRKYYGYAGKILRVDLSTCTIKCEPIDEYFKWLGGTGIAEWILYNEIKPWVQPFDPMNKLIFSAGPLVGTLAPTASRLSAVSKSPVTLGIGTSNAGGFVAPELKYAGYDLIVFSGRSSRPVYLYINDDRVRIKDALHLWGKTTWDTEDIIKAELGEEKIQVMSIGPAGENLVRSSSIMVNKNRALGRCGMGSVMGSKNLKAVAVRGTGFVEAADPERLMEIVESILEGYSKSKVLASLMKFGTVGGTEIKVRYSGFPYKNFQDLNLPPEMLAELNPLQTLEKHKVGQVSCISCPFGCIMVYDVKSGPYAGLKSESAHMEPLTDYCAKLAVADFTFCIKATSLCNQYGLDVDLPAEAIAWVMECYEKGLLSEKEVDGLKPLWGDAGVALELIRKIAYREGFGNILAEGVARAADIMGEETKYFAMHNKGQELYEALRHGVAWALGVCTSTRGGGHTTGAPVCEVALAIDEVKAKEKYRIDTFHEPQAWEGKAQLVKYYEMLHRLNNSLGLCHFGTDWNEVSSPGFEEITELYKAVTGLPVSIDSMKETALRMLNVEKAFNILHAGFSREDDYPTRRAMQEPIPSGYGKGFCLEKDKFDALLDEYYEMHGWDKQTSFPTRVCLDKIGLASVADDLEKAGKYPFVQRN